MQDHLSAQDIFLQQWQTYRKVMDHNYMFHAEVYGTLHRLLVEDVARPFRFMDIACGDASATARALKDTAIAHYEGVDISQPALDLAAAELKALPCPVTLLKGDFARALDWGDPVDVVWIGQSLHHLRTEAKLDYMREVRARLSRTGMLVTWEPTTRDGEDRAGWLRRFEVESRPFWPAMTEGEWSAMVEHIRGADNPETLGTWLSLGHEAGFSTAQEVLATPRDLSRVYCYRV